MILSPGLSPITGAHDTKLSPRRAEAGLLPLGAILSLLAQATQVLVCHGEHCVSELISECPNLCLLKKSMLDFDVNRAGYKSQLYYFLSMILGKLLNLLSLNFLIYTMEIKVSTTVGFV